MNEYLEKHLTCKLWSLASCLAASTHKDTSVPTHFKIRNQIKKSRREKNMNDNFSKKQA